ncbi:MAG: gamma-glutamyltransferase family protein [Alphaproteobacteria bacterium]|nr:gamma-glutamyltransferase family protein [Alphaproteobacteria bacterium]
MMSAFTTRPEIRGTFGAVASTHWLASAVGMSILEQGGNAFDAAAAAGFTLQVVEPHLNGPLGEAPILMWSEAARRCEMICGQGVAPAAATIAHFRSLGLDLIPGTGLLAAAVPAAFGAWMRLLQDWGTMPLAAILAPAIAYAEGGYPVVDRVSETVAVMSEMFRREWPSSAAVYLPHGRPPEPGRLFRNPALAATYRRVIAEAGEGPRENQIERARACWYQGFVAEAIDRFCRCEKVFDVSGRRHGGLLTGDDMAGWRVPVEQPLNFDYRNYTICKGGPWSQGPVLLQILALLQGFDLDDLDPLGADFVHILVECMKLALADREAWYGDPDFVEVPMPTLLSPAYNEARRRLVGDDASLELRPGVPDGRRPRVPVGGHETAAGAGIGEPTLQEEHAGMGEPTVSPLGMVAGDTCHLDVIDRWGNMVSATPSGGWLQSSPAIPELGFCLGTRMQMFWLEDGLPASLAPGKRPRTTLSPSLAFKDGKPYMVFGTPGGDQQDQWSAQMLLHHIHHRMNLQEAIDCPAFNTKHPPSSFYPRDAQLGLVAIEDRFPPSTCEALTRRGHRLAVGGAWSQGRLSGCAREQTPEGMIIKAAANPRGMQGYAVGR